MLVTLPGIIGLVFFIPAYLGIKDNIITNKLITLFFIIIPGFLLIFVFSYPAVPALHGFQAIVPLTLLLGLKFLTQAKHLKYIYPLLITQIILSFVILGVRANSLGIEPNALFVKQHAVLDLNALVNTSKFKVIDAKTVPNFGVKIKIDGEEKSTLWINPSTKLLYEKIYLGDSPIFSSYLAIHPDVWSERGADGAVFRLLILRNNIELAHFEKFINPFHNLRDRHWIDFSVDLERFKNQEVDIVLSVNAGPNGNEYADWCLFGSAVLKDAFLESNRINSKKVSSNFFNENSD